MSGCCIVALLIIFDPVGLGIDWSFDLFRWSLRSPGIRSPCVEISVLKARGAYKNFPVRLSVCSYDLLWIGNYSVDNLGSVDCGAVELAFTF